MNRKFEVAATTALALVAGFASAQVAEFQYSQKRASK